MNLNRTAAITNAALLVALMGTAGATAQEPELEPMDPIVCDDGQTVEVKNRLIETDGTAIEANGRCRVVIRGSRIVSESVAIVARVRSHIEIIDSEIEGAGGVLALARGKVLIRGSQVTGGVLARHKAEIEDVGGNEIDGKYGGPTTTLGARAAGDG